MDVVVFTQLQGNIVTRQTLTLALVLGALFTTIIASSCSAPEPHPIDYGNVQCTSCKMLVADTRFGAEAVSNTGKIYVFDALECMLGWYLAEEDILQSEIHSLWVSDHSRPGTLINTSSALYVQSDELRSPMSMNVASFADERAQREAIARYGGESITFEQALSLAEDYR